jgi:hypothetical protein
VSGKEQKITDLELVAAIITVSRGYTQIIRRRNNR